MVYPFSVTDMASPSSCTQPLIELQVLKIIPGLDLSHKTKSLTFHIFPWNTGCLIGILIIFIMVYYNPQYNWIVCHPLYTLNIPKQPGILCFIAHLDDVMISFYPRSPPQVVCIQVADAQVCQELQNTLHKAYPIVGAPGRNYCWWLKSGEKTGWGW